MSKCTIKDGKYFAPNGEESLLYRNLRENMSEDEANDLFVLSKTPSFQENVINPLIESHRNKTLEIPANIKFKETFANKIRTFHIYSGKTKVGRIQMTPYKDGFKVKSSLVNEDQRGKGFGKYLYNYTISKLLVENSVLYTDTARTEAADRVWESLKKQGLSQDGKSVKPLPKEFDKNGEIGMSTVLQYTADNFSQTLPLNAVEKSHLINLQIEGVETSDDLYNVLYDAFYKNNLFSPNINKLKKIYSEDEIRNILEDSEIQGRVKETIEKLRQTEEFTIPQIKYNKDFDVRSSKVNIIGQYKKQNPLKLEQQVKEQDYVKVPVVNEAGEQLETQLFYENAIKAPSDKSIRALQAIVGAHPMVDTTKLENKLIKTFKNYGMDIEGIERENFKELLDYVTEPTDENRKALEDVLGFVREPLTKPINISPENRSYQYLKTAKSEQELFDEMSLIQTTTPNVYHKINKIDEQEMRDIQENQDLTVPDYQLYKDYYGYELASEIETIKNKAVADGTFMKAPNGKPTNLSKDNWLFVRTQTFKNWSSSWKDTLMDENNEPKVFFHSSKEKGITEFLMQPSNDDLAIGGFFVTPKKGWDFAKTGIEYKLFVGYSNKDIFDIENEDNVANFAYRIFDDYRKDLGKIEYSDIFDIITPEYNRTYYTVFKEKYSKEIEERSKRYKEKNLFDELGDFYRVQSKEELLLEDLEKYRDETDELSLVLNTLNDIYRRHSLYRNYTSIERNGNILKKLGFKGAYVFESKVKNIHLYNTDRIKSAENVRAQIEQESNDIRYFKKPSTQKQELLLEELLSIKIVEKICN